MFLFLLYVISAFIVSIIYYKLNIKWCLSSVCLAGKTVIVTGGDSGMGLECALEFAKRGARVIITSLDEKTIGEKARRKIIEQSDNKNVHVKQIDLRSFKSVQLFAKEINDTEEKIDILVNNAGIGYDNSLTEDGLDTVMQVNYFSAFLLTNLLLGKLKKAKKARIVNVSSKVAIVAFFLDLHNLTSNKGYAASKKCLAMFTYELANKLKNTSTVTTYAVHPGVVSTPIWLFKVIEIFMKCFKDSKQGAQNTLCASLDKDIEHLSGSFFADCNHVGHFYGSINYDKAGELWIATENVLGSYLKM